MLLSTALGTSGDMPETLETAQPAPDLVPTGENLAHQVQPSSAIASSPRDMHSDRAGRRTVVGREAKGFYGTMCVRNHACCFFSISSSRAMASLSMPTFGALLLARSPQRENCRSSDPSRILSV
jgi:hypothetical protein